MAVRILLPPELEQQGWHRGEHDFRSMDLGMASGTERDHQMQQRSARYPMMDRD